jgi:hypothetical protein
VGKLTSQGLRIDSPFVFRDRDRSESVDEEEVITFNAFHQDIHPNEL